MGSLGSEADHGGREMFHGHSDPVVDELNRLENLLRGLFPSSSLALIRIQEHVQLCACMVFGHAYIGIMLPRRVLAMDIRVEFRLKQVFCFCCKKKTPTPR
jgi:hypothetical protein